MSKQRESETYLDYLKRRERGIERLFRRIHSVWPISLGYRDMAWLTIYWRVSRRPLPQRCIRMGVRVGRWPDKSCRFRFPYIDYVWRDE